MTGELRARDAERIPPVTQTRSDATRQLQCGAMKSRRRPGKELGESGGLVIWARGTENYKSATHQLGGCIEKRWGM